IYLRRVALYPLSYGGSGASSTTGAVEVSSLGAAGTGDLAAQAVDEGLGLGLALGSQPRQLLFLKGQFAQEVVEAGGTAPMAGRERAQAGGELAADGGSGLVLLAGEVAECHFLLELL